MAICTGKSGSIYTIDDIIAFTTEATTEDGSTMIYQIDNTDKRMWDPNIPITINIGSLDTSYYDGGVNWFEGKVKLLTAGETTLTVSGSYVTIQQVGKVYGFSISMNQAVGEITEIGDTWKANTSLGKSASVSLSRYRYDNLFIHDESGYQECGLTGKTLTTATGLDAATQYYFKVNVDGAGVVEEDITTASDVTYDAVITLMNTALAASGIFEIVNGDLRCTSDSEGASSSIALSAGATGTDLFATLTGFTAFDEAVAGSDNTKHVLLKLYEDADSGFWAKALKTSFATTKGINSIDDESLSFEVDANIAYFS